MAEITNLTTLKTAIEDYLARDDLTTYLNNFIQSAEDKLYRSLNLRNEETALSVSISSGAAAVPSDFKRLKYAYIDDTPVSLLEWVPIEELYRRYPDRSETTSRPDVISREAGNFIFGPVASAQTLKGVYYAKQDSILDTDPSWYVTNAPDVLLYGALKEAAIFIRDREMLQFWDGFFKEAVQTVKDEQDNAEVSDGQLVQVAG